MVLRCDHVMILMMMMMMVIVIAAWSFSSLQESLPGLGVMKKETSVVYFLFSMMFCPDLPGPARTMQPGSRMLLLWRLPHAAERVSVRPNLDDTAPRFDTRTPSVRRTRRSRVKVKDRVKCGSFTRLVNT